MKGFIVTSTRSGTLIILLFLVSMIQACSIFQPKGAEKPDKPRAQQPDTTAKRAKDTLEVDQKKLDSLKRLKARKDSLDQLYPIQKPDTFNIAMVLPLFTEVQTDTFNLSKRNKAIANVAVSFYTGARLAFDSLSNCGMHINLKVYDSRNDSIRMLTIREKMKQDTPDLILGPLFTRNIKLLNKFTQQTKTNIVSPLASVPVCLKNNPYYTSMDPGKDVIARQVANLIHRKFKGSNIYVVRQYAKAEREIAKRMDTFVDTSKVKSYQKIALEENQWNTSRIFKDTLSKEKNVIFIPSEDESFTTSAISGIKGVDTVFTIDSVYNQGTDTAKNFHDIQDDVTIIGLQEWLDYGSLDGSMMEQFKMHILSDYHVDYSSLPTAAMVREYRKSFHTEPDKYAIKAFDITLLLGKLMANYGIYFQRYWDDKIYKGIHSNFRFDQERGQRGWQNYFLQQLQFQDYKLQRVQH